MTTKQEQLINKIYELQSKIQLITSIDDFSHIINSIMDNLNSLRLLSVGEVGQSKLPTEYEEGLIPELKSLEQEIIKNGLSYLKVNYFKISSAINLLILGFSGVGQSEIDELINRGH